MRASELANTAEAVQQVTARFDLGGQRVTEVVTALTASRALRRAS